MRKIFKVSLIASCALICTSAGVVLSLVHGKSALDLEVCIDGSNWRGAAAVCREALYRLHPTPDEVRELNAEGGIWRATEMRDDREARRLLRHYMSAGVDINAVNVTSKYRWTALHLQVGGPNLRAISLLLEAGADPLRRDASGHTPADRARDLNGKRPDPAYTQAIALLELAASAPQR
jgi:hypothetical protein